MKNVIITPVYEDAIALSMLIRELKSELGQDLYLIAVDDGSVRHPLDIKVLLNNGIKGAVINLNQNIGHQRAIAVGLSFATDKFPNANCIVMDSDGEDKPSQITGMLEKLSKEDVDVVVAKRRKRQESLQFRMFYFLYKIVFMLSTGKRINFGNFMALKPHSVNRITSMQEIWTHLAACVLTSKLRTYFCLLDRGSRYAGKSKMNFPDLVLHGFRAFMVFAEDVLVRVGVACMMVSVLSIIAIIVSVGLKTIGMATPGWFSVALGILVLVLLQTGALTLISLLMTGLLRSRSNTNTNYLVFVSKITESNHANKEVS